MLNNPRCQMRGGARPCQLWECRKESVKISDAASLRATKGISGRITIAAGATNVPFRIPASHKGQFAALSFGWRGSGALCGERRFDLPEKAAAIPAIAAGL